MPITETLTSLRAHASVIKTTARAATMCLLVGLGACGDDAIGSSSETGVSGDADMVCVPGHQIECVCEGGADGIQLCVDDGSSYGACECEAESSTGPTGTGGGTGDSDSGDPCGDQVCDDNMGENCETCPLDCGACAMCLAAPDCEGVLIPPIIEEHMHELDVHTMNAWGGAPSTRSASEDPDPEACDDPQLRLRVASLTIHEEEDILGNDIVYCAIITETGAGSELRLLAPTPPLGEGEEHTYALSEGIIWGQADAVVYPEGNMLITYNCFEQDSVEGWQALLEALGDAADGLGGLPGELGWIFEGIGAIADVLGAALAFEQDDHLFNASQIIPKEAMLEMTNGVWWGVRQSGKEGLSEWDWELRVEAWGCAENGMAPHEP